MKQVCVCVCRDGMEAHFLRAVLEGEGIEARVVGEALGQVVGSLPATSVMPEIWVAEGEAERARDVLAEARAGRWVRGMAGEWVCPGCGERVEGQFTDCWKCGTGRPVGAEEDPRAEALGLAKEGDGDHVVGADVACVGCGYNLRGLPGGHVCPECGKSVVPSLVAAWRGAEGEVRVGIREVMRGVAGRLGYPVEAVLFVLGAYGEMMSRTGWEGEPGKMDVRWFCAALGWYAGNRFGTPERAEEELRGWGIAGSGDVGRIIAVACEAGVGEEVAERFAAGNLGVGEWFREGRGRA